MPDALVYLHIHLRLSDKYKTRPALVSYDSGAPEVEEDTGVKGSRSDVESNGVAGSIQFLL